MAKSDPYSRIYWRFIDEYPAIYDDELALATWVKLLILADGTYPSAAPLPRWVDDSPLSLLVDAGLVIMEGQRYRIKGLEAERARRSEQGIAGANARWTQYERITPAMRTHSERNGNAMLDEKSKEEKRRAIRAQERVDAGEFLTFAQALEAVRTEK